MVALSRSEAETGGLGGEALIEALKAKGIIADVDFPPALRALIAKREALRRVIVEWHLEGV